MKQNVRCWGLASGAALLACTVDGFFARAQLYESDRVEEYHRRGHVWPPLESEYIPNNPGWRQMWERRFHQIEQMDDSSGDARYNGFMSSVHCALLCPNFTENGWGLTRAPPHVVEGLKQRLHDGLNDPKTQTEAPGHGVNGENMPLFVDTMAYNADVMHELLPIHEAWAGGVKLAPTTAFGLRVYRNATNLGMHVDQSQSHIVSSILHVDHDPDSEPWPIYIEDLHGNLNEVVLESGDMLLYESSKCMHGRPTNFSGSWYSSLFIHYQPVDWDGRKIWFDAQYRIPPRWNERRLHDDKLDKLVVEETFFFEPGCEHGWCGLEEAVKWSGPAEAIGKVLSRDGVITTIDLPEEWTNEL